MIRYKKSGHLRNTITLSANELKTIPLKVHSLPFNPGSTNNKNEFNTFLGSKNVSDFTYRPFISFKCFFLLMHQTCC